MVMMRIPPRLVPAAAAAVLILAACGSDDPASTDDAGSVSTIDGVDGTGMRAPVPIEITGGSAAGGGGLAADQSTAASAEGAATSDMMIAPWIAEYVVGDGMPPLPTDDVGYVFAAGATATAEQVQELAGTLGVTAEAVRIDEGFGVSWRVGPDDGSAPSVWLFEDAQLSWNYSSAWDEGGVVTSCAVAVDSDGNEIGECPEPEPPSGVPSGADAEQRARELLAALGEDPSTMRFDTFADDWFASVSITDTTDGRAPGRTWNFGFGAEGVMQFAGGTLAVPEPVGPYGLIDLEAAIARLTDQSGFFGGFGGGLGGVDLPLGAPGVAETGVAVEAGVAAEPAIAESAIAEDPASVDVLPADDETVEVLPDESGETVPGEPPVEPEPMPVDPMPVEPLPPLPEPEPITVTLVDVEADFWWAWDTDGAVWLLPAYRFIDSDGGWHVVPAVTDDFLIRVEPDDLPMPEPLPAPEPMPVDDAPVIGEGDVVDADEPVESPIDEAPSPEPDVPSPAPEPAVDPLVLDELVGISLAEFERQAEELGFVTRVAVLDGEALALTEDFVTNRANVAVEADVVVAVEFIG